MKSELEAAIAENAPWGARISFLDSISSLEELEQLKGLSGREHFGDLIEYYEDNLKRWSDPKLPEGFERRYPLVAERLNTPEKVRIFLRGGRLL